MILNKVDQLEKKIAELESKIIELGNVIDNLPGDIYWKDRNGVYLGINAYGRNSLREMGFPYKEEEIIGKTDYDLYDQETADGFRKNDLYIMKSGAKSTKEESATLPSGKKIIQLSTKRPLLNESGEVIGIAGNTVDITHLKELERDLKIALAVKSEFMANMSHDLRTPIAGTLAIINGILYESQEALLALQNPSSLTEAKKTELLKDLATRSQEYGGIAHRAIKEISEFCDEILDTIRLESGQVKTTPKSFDLQALLDRSITLLKPVAQERQLTLSVKRNSEVPRYLNGLRHYLNRIVLNLMSNGLKFTEQGGITVHVMLPEAQEKPLTSGDAITLVITVTDTGMGIPEDKFETIFEHFSRLTPSYQGIYKGAGLGLYTVKQYVNAMRGQITVTSELGKGSCFTLTVPMTVASEDEVEKGAPRITREEQRSIQKESTAVPLVEGEAHPEEVPQSERAVGREGKAPIRIMLVEDNPMLAKATAMSLQPLGWIVDLVGDGETAVEKAQQTYYDMIFMDIGLPKMDGIETTACIRALPNPEHAQVPIVAVTGHAREDHYEACMTAGMNEVFRKPLPPALFEEALQRFGRKPEAVKTPEEPITLPPEPEAIIIDWEATIQACDNDRNHVNELLDIFMDDFAETERVLATAYQNRDIKAIELRLHYTISVFYYLIFPQVDQALRALETVVKTTPLDQAALDRTYQATHKAIQAVWKVLKAERWIALS